MIDKAIAFDEIDDPSEELGDYIALLKPRVMSLSIFTAICGILMAPGHIHPLLGFITVLCISVGAGASGCLNMWYDRDIDAIMQRTKDRPLPAGRIAPDNALAFGMILSAASVMVLGIAVNWLSAALLAFTIFFYVVIYTVWLKRWTAQNIVIGGAAGALPPVIGWAAVTNHVGIEAWILFTIIFLWTPPHFWALSLYRHDDYLKAKVPVMPVVAGEASTKRQIIGYTLLTILATAAPYFVGMGSVIYLSIALVLGGSFLLLAVQLYFLAGSQKSMRLFGYSITYLFLIFSSLTIDIWIFS
ncbi:heme o synthase [Candidatus Paracaedibacter symbiosus]|uniref:heme o synthase n=1 Tax=Candidatus Paracaedibacter symbiosus TaxID=244582 RepID=UPI000AF12AB9|nr:heme o synthase [Candidatus Paracaedibacter symbiosus]